MKFRKYFKIKYSGNNTLQYDKLYSGSIGLKALGDCNLTTEQLTAAIRSLKRVIKKKNFLIIRTLPFWMLTRKPRDVRMGRGKGNPSLKIYPLRAGKIIFEIKGISKGPVIRALHSSSLRLPVLTTIVKKYDQRTDNIKGGW
jgi:large subunit ribosomal protein L16